MIPIVTCCCIVGGFTSINRVALVISAYVVVVAHYMSRCAQAFSIRAYVVGAAVDAVVANSLVVFVDATCGCITAVVRTQVGIVTPKRGS